MSEHVSNPFLSYNSTGNVKTLIGNWQEQERLKDVTGCSRTQAVAKQHQPEEAQATVYAVRQDAAVHEPTHTRVIEHTEQLLPTEWLTSNSLNFQNPQARLHDLAAYTKAKKLGPRKEQELKLMLQEAAVQKPPAPAVASFETTAAATYKPHSLEGLHVGARVMKAQDGSPVKRDPTFLAEMKIFPPATAERLMGSNNNSTVTSSGLSNNGLVASSSQYSEGGGLGSPNRDPSVPITIYTEAAAKSTFNGHFYGTGSMVNKASPMNRNDNFTKLMSDVNKRTDDQ